ncbi:MAG: trigger factor [Cytophagales bacterium]|nr:trigger factor [Cytophagales bacterium]
MEITLDKTDKTEGLIKVNLKEADYQPAVNQKVKEYSKKANIKGFRPGKVPESMIRSMYGKSLMVEEINHMVGHKLSDYLKESDLQFLGEPLPNREKADAIDWETQKDFVFEYSIGFANDFELKIDKKVKTERYKIKIDEDVTNETIENLQRQFGEPEVVEIVEEKDFVYGPIVSADELINKELKIDMKELEKGAWKKFRKSKVADKISIEAKKLYKSPNLLKHQLGLTDEEYKKIKGRLSITIQGIERIKEVPVDQALFDKTFGEGTVDSLDTFKEKVKEAVSKNYISEESQFFNFKLRERLIDKAKIVLPDNFLRKWLMEINEEMTEELLEKEYASYAKELKWSLIRNNLVKTQNIEIDNEEVLQEAKTLIRNQFAASGMGEGMEDQLDNFANNYLQGENGDNYMKVFSQVQNRRVMDFLESEITIKEKEVSLDAFRKMT